MRLDEIGEWSQIKLKIIQKYAVPYTEIISSSGYFNFFYIDGFSGSGIHIDKKTKKMIPGSPVRVLETEEPFLKYYFIDIDGEKVNFLANFCKTNFPEREVEVIKGDCNKEIKNIISGMAYENYDRIFCLLDPYGLHLKWDIIEAMGRKGIVDLILNFPIMDMNRNAIWRDHKRVSEREKVRMTQFWGDDSWLSAAYQTSPQSDLFETNPMDKQSNEVIANAFRDRLKKVAKFKFVLPPMPLKNSHGATIYYLFFASQHPKANSLAESIFRKYRGG